MALTGLLFVPIRSKSVLVKFQNLEFGFPVARWVTFIPVALGRTGGRPPQTTIRDGMLLSV